MNRRDAAILLVLVLVLIIFGPFLFVWSWNTLFGTLLTIPYNIKTWFATLLLYSFFNGKVSHSKNR